MGVFEMVVLLVLIGTGGKVVQSYFERRAAPLPDGRVRELEAALQANELRLAQTEDRVAELSEKVVFVERLLEAPERSARLPSA